MPAKNGRNVSLTHEQHALVERLVKSGRYASASEVVRDGLRLLQREENAQFMERWLLEGLNVREASHLPTELVQRASRVIREKIRAGLEEAERGEFVDGRAFFSRWKDRIKSAASKPAKKRVKRRG